MPSPSRKLRQNVSSQPEPVSEPRLSRPLTVIGHRGARGLAPENTLLALDTGIRCGAPWLEFDVQRCADDSLVLLHDLTLDRTTNGTGLLDDHSFEALRALDAGRGQQIPTLEEALDLIEQRASVNIELKSAGGTAEAVAAVVRQYVASGWPAERFLVSSFHLPELWEFKQAAPEIPVAALYCGVPLDWAGSAAELGAVAVNLSAEFIDTRLIEDARSHGMKVYVYTVNDVREANGLAQLGIDGIFTDFPDKMLKAQDPLG
jgi:glycerophosphoryl diester phosphodiesterase